MSEQIPLRLIDRGDNVRFDVGTVHELAASIKRIGVVVPLILRPKEDGRYEILAGHRRFAACKLAKLKSVPATLREVPDSEVTELMVAENLHRRDLSPLELAKAMRRMRDQGLSVDDVAERVGKSSAWVYQHLRVLQLPEEIQDKVHRRELRLMAALGYGQKKQPVTGPIGVGVPTPVDLPGLVYVIVKLRGQKNLEVEVDADRDAVLNRRDELERTGEFRKVFVCPCKVGVGAMEQAS